MVAPLETVGMAASEFSSHQRDLLNHLIEAYLSSLPPEIARQRLDVITRDEPKRIYFGWAGGLEPGQADYLLISPEAVAPQHLNLTLLYESEEFRLYGVD